MVATGGGAGTSAGAAPAVDKPKPAAAGGNVLEELRKIMQGEELAKSITTALNVGGTDVAGQIKEAFKGALPEVIQMKAELGTISVKIVGGKVLEGWSEGVITRMREEITTAIRTQVIPQALYQAEGTAGQSAASTGAGRTPVAPKM